MHRGVVVFFVLLTGFLWMAGGAAAQKPGTSPTSVRFGEAHITIPPGWRHAEQQAGASKILLINPSDISTKKKLVVYLLPGKDLNGVAFAQAFDAVVKAGMANERLIKNEETPARKADGYDLLTRMMVVEDAAGHRSIRICFGANPGQRLHMLIVNADSQETLKQYEAGMTSLLASYSFGDTDAAAANKDERSAAAQATASTASSISGSQPANSDTEAKQAQGSVATGSKGALVGRRARLADGESVLLCKDAARLDFAMTAAKYGNTYDARRALSYDYFFRVSGPAVLEVKESQLKSDWPKVFVTIVNGDSAGRTGWVILSELTDLK